MGNKLGRDAEDDQLYSFKCFGIQKQKENWVAMYDVDSTTEKAILLGIH